MQNEGPPLEAWTRRLADTPADFLASPWPDGVEGISAQALVHDACAATGAPMDVSLRDRFSGTHPDSKPGRRWLGLCAVVCWLVADDDRSHLAGLQAEFARLFSETLPELASQATAQRCVDDDERREELARTVMAAFHLRPAGETLAQAQDRLIALSSTERHRLLAATRATEARARNIREALVRKAAQEAADKYTRE